MLHEVPDQAGLFRPVTKEALRVERAEDVGPVVARALTQAATPPARPVYVEVPTDLLAAQATGKGQVFPVSKPDPGAARRGLDPCRRGACGCAAAAGLGRRRRASARATPWPRWPSASARRSSPPTRPAALAGDHPLAVGLPPHLPRTGALWDQADAVVAVGSDLDGMSTQNWLHPRPPTLVAINVDPADAAKNYEPDVVVEGDAALAADLAAQVDGPREPWVDLPSAAPHRA